MHWHGSWRIGNRPAGVRIENVTIADTGPGHIAVAVAIGGESTARNFYEASGGAGAVHILDCEVPRGPIPPRAGNPQVATQIHEHRCAGMALGERERPVDCVLFADAPKVDFHADLQLEYRSIPGDLIPNHVSECIAHRKFAWNVLRPTESPSSPQGTRGDVDQSLAQAATRILSLP